MKIQIGDNTFVVGWKYNEESKKIPGFGYKSVEVTVCSIRQLVDNKPVSTDLASAKVTKYVNDPYNKDKARRFSLQKLLSNDFAGKSNKKFRGIIWDAYNNRNKEVAAFAD